MKNIDILNASQALAQLSQEKLPATVGIKIRRLTRQMAEATGDIDAERAKLLEAHAKRGADGEMLFVDAERTQVQMNPEFAAEWNALLAADADMMVDRPLRASDLGDMKVTPALLMLLGDLLEDGEE